MKMKEIAKLKKWEEDLAKRERKFQLRRQGNRQVSGDDDQSLGSGEYKKV